MRTWKTLTREEKIQAAMGWTIIVATGVICYKKGQKNPKQNVVR